MGGGRGRGCFACRVMRSFAFSGLGAGLAALAALGLGLDQAQVVNWVLAGGLITGVAAAQRRRR